jgi:hypothetical protein
MCFWKTKFYVGCEHEDHREFVEHCGYMSPIFELHKLGQGVANWYREAEERKCLRWTTRTDRERIPGKCLACRETERIEAETTKKEAEPTEERQLDKTARL